MVATTGKVPVFVAIKGDMLPVPLAARPMLVVLLIQVYVVVPSVLLVVKTTGIELEPLHKI